jgi:hypothetical protein
MMKATIFILLGGLFLVPACKGQTIEQCKSASKELASIKTDSDFTNLVSSMTAGDEMNLSSRLARCVERYSADLTPLQVDKLNRIVYRLDADVISRMYNFLEHHRLAETFNDEQESKRKK